jgi:hypothetical protein
VHGGNEYSRHFTELDPKNKLLLQSRSNSVSVQLLDIRVIARRVLKHVVLLGLLAVHLDKGNYPTLCSVMVFEHLYNGGTTFGRK